jgi:hypothetical protein
LAGRLEVVGGRISPGGLEVSGRYC